MIQLTHDTPILLGVQPADFRKGIDGFQGLCSGALGQDPRDGTLYVFINRARTMVRALVYDQGGFWLMTKRISTGRFRGWPVAGQAAMEPASARRLRVLLDGGHWTAEPAGASEPIDGLAVATRAGAVPIPPVRVTVAASSCPSRSTPHPRT